jgi:hypothetical protein
LPNFGCVRPGDQNRTKVFPQRQRLAVVFQQHDRFMRRAPRHLEVLWIPDDPIRFLRIRHVRLIEQSLPELYA